MIRLIASAFADTTPIEGQLGFRGPVLVIVILVVLMKLFSRSGNGGRNALGLVLMSAVGIITTVALLSLRGSVSSELAPVDPPQESLSPTTEIPEITSIDPLLNPPSPAFSLEPERGLTNGAESEDEETVWLPVGKDTLAKLFGEEHVDDIASLSEELSKHSETAYALIPVTEAQPAPVLRHVLTPTPFRELLTPHNLQLLAAALDGYSTDSEDESVFEVEAGEPVLAAWVHERPGLGQMVVKTKEFHESTIPAEEALRPAIHEALKDHITEIASREFSIGDDWTKLVDLSVSDRALQECILRTDRKVSEIETVEGKTVMQQTYALIQFPEEAEASALEVIRGRLIQSRAIAVGLTLGALWLGAVLLAIACRLSQTGSFLKRWTTGPLFVVAAVPCLIAFAIMIGAMIEGHTFELGPAGDGPVAYVLDVE